MDCKRLDEGYELFLIGARPGDAALDLREHLAQGCERCLERTREAVETIYLLSLNARPARPHPRLKAQLMQRWRKK